MYTYACTVLRVVDGDTLDLMIDLGFSIHIKQRVRLYGINCPETRTRDKKEKAAGLAAKSFVLEWLRKTPEITVRTHKDKKGKFGRILADICGPEGTATLNTKLVITGHAVVYLGGKRKK